MSSTGDDILDLLRGVCARILAVDTADVVLDARLREDLGADSLDFAELNMALEDELGLTIGQEEFRTVSTVADAVELVRRHRDGASERV